MAMRRRVDTWKGNEEEDARINEIVKNDIFYDDTAEEEIESEPIYIDFDDAAEMHLIDKRRTAKKRKQNVKKVQLRKKEFSSYRPNWWTIKSDDRHCVYDAAELELARRRVRRKEDADIKKMVAHGSVDVVDNQDDFSGNGIKEVEEKQVITLDEFHLATTMIKYANEIFDNGRNRETEEYLMILMKKV